MPKTQANQLQLPILVEVSTSKTNGSHLKQHQLADLTLIREPSHMGASDDDELIYNSIISNYFNMIREAH
ncbi:MULTISPECIES: hypothetical protein [Lonsdalea]|uniref:hypothetical protein n=1 Tax=Lonsdalea TaxID=1082702 RepID=UPI0011BF46DA|nr:MULTISPECIES: hypothetical protein [Lonsdalea]